MPTYNRLAPPSNVTLPPQNSQNNTHPTHKNNLHFTSQKTTIPNKTQTAPNKTSSTPNFANKRLIPINKTKIILIFAQSLLNGSLLCGPRKSRCQLSSAALTSHDACSPQRPSPALIGFATTILFSTKFYRHLTTPLPTVGEQIT